MHAVHTMGADASAAPLVSPARMGQVIAHFSLPPVRRAFDVRHINIVDPLLETNNLGRSVTKASTFRIIAAFQHSADELQGIFTLAVRFPSPTLDKTIYNQVIWDHTRARRLATGHLHPCCALALPNIRLNKIHQSDWGSCRG